MPNFRQKIRVDEQFGITNQRLATAGYELKIGDSQLVIMDEGVGKEK